MATINPFDLLGDDDTEDPSLLISAMLQKAPAPAPAPAPAKKAPAQAQQAAKPEARLPAKPLPPAQAVREAKNEGGQRGRGRGAGRGGGHGRGYNRDFADNENKFGNNNGFAGGYRVSEDGDAGNPSERRPYGGPRGGGDFRGGRGGGFSNGETPDGERPRRAFDRRNGTGRRVSEDGDAGNPFERRPYGGPRGGGDFRGGRFSNGETSPDGERPRRAFDRRSGTGRGNEFKREGSGRGNWGAPTDEIAPETEEPVKEGEKNIDAEKEPEQDVTDANKDSSANEQEEEPEEKEMTLEEYEKVREEKRKALPAFKSEERKVNLDKELESMQLLSNKKNDDEIFIKLCSDKEKRKEAVEKAKKAVSINEFLKPAEGESSYQSGGRGRGRGRGRGSYGGSNRNNMQAPAIEDVGQFPSLGGK